MLGTLPVPNGWFYIREEQGVAVLKLANCNKMAGSGCHGRYYNLRNGLGVKILTDTWREDPRSIEWNSTAKAEISNYIKANKVFPDISPQVYCVMPILYKNGSSQDRYYPGIVMEHIDGYYTGSGSSLYYMLKYELELRLAQENVTNTDLHNSNYIVRKDGKPVIVDWGYTSWDVNKIDVKYLKQEYSSYLEQLEVDRAILKNYVPLKFEDVG